MAEKTEDLNLPLSVVTRIIKDALPEGVNVSREARTAIARAASVFVLYATATANSYAVKSKRKTLSAADVIEAMKDMEFEELVEPLTEVLQSWKQSAKYKKAKLAKSKVASDALNEENADQEMETTEGEVDQTDGNFERKDSDNIDNVSANAVTSTKNVSVVQLGSDVQGDSELGSDDEDDQNVSD